MNSVLKSCFLFLAFIYVVCASAGDWFTGFDKIIGKWTPEKGTHSDLSDSKKMPNISITATESRGNAINVYFLDSAGKKKNLFFSTSTSLAKKGALKFIRAKPFVSQEDPLDVTLTEASATDETQLQIKSLEKNKIILMRTMKSDTTTCLLKKI